MFRRNVLPPFSGQYVSSKLWDLLIYPHCVTTQKTNIDIVLNIILSALKKEKNDP
jgi:hypothetical protein